MNPLTLILVLSIAMGSIAHGWTYRSPTSSALYQIGLVIRMHQDATGETIRSWEEFDRVWGSTNFKELEELRMRERYAFVDLPHPSPGQSGTVLLISRSPFKDTTRKQNWLGMRYKALTEEGRWMLIKSDRGISSQWISEKRLGAWIVNASLTLPTPDSVGSYPHESDYWMSVCTNTAIGVTGIGYLTFSLIRYVRAKKKNNANKTLHPTAGNVLL